jgi:hypothetical protein
LDKPGEPYLGAGRPVLAARDDRPAPGLDVVETIDVSAQAAELGLACRATMFPQLAAHVDAAVALARLRDALHATEDDPGMKVMRALVLRGEAPPPPTRELRRFEDLRGFIRRVRAGIGGASPGGYMLALIVKDVMMLCVAASTKHGEPIVYLQTVDDVVGQRNLIAL